MDEWTEWRIKGCTTSRLILGDNKRVSLEWWIHRLSSTLLWSYFSNKNYNNQMRQKSSWGIWGTGGGRWYMERDTSRSPFMLLSPQTRQTLVLIFPKKLNQFNWCRRFLIFASADLLSNRMHRRLTLWQSSVGSSSSINDLIYKEPLKMGE